jgi:hypothetical protein
MTGVPQVIYQNGKDASDLAVFNSRQNTIDI